VFYSRWPPDDPETAAVRTSAKRSAAGLGTKIDLDAGETFNGFFKPATSL